MTNPLLACDGQALKALVQAGLAWLEQHQQLVNSLNVYPVPDGDTGTNMVLTMRAACQEIEGDDSDHAGRIAEGIAKGARYGGRGNSGVILSQLWRGFAHCLADCSTFNAALFAHALREAQKSAYQGVVKAVEGTILTVARESADAAEKAASESRDLAYVFAQVAREAQQSVARTPAFLPILRQAGVVDAGGQGLAFILEGAHRHMTGQSLLAPASQTHVFVPPVMALEGVESGQDWEIVADIRLVQPLDWPKLHRELAELGTSIQLGGGDDSLRVHIHVPEERLFSTQSYMLHLGTVTQMALENLRDQVEMLQNAPRPTGDPAPETPTYQVGVVAVAPGDGLAKVFTDYGAAAIVRGGQTMNPSTQELLQVVRRVRSLQVVLLPNNKNVILAAQQAAEIGHQETGREIAVVPSRTVPEGIAALLAWNGDKPTEVNVRAMERAMSQVISGAVTTASRDADMDGKQVVAGQVIGLTDDHLVAVGSQVPDVVLETLERMGLANRENITLYYGDFVQLEDAASLVQLVRQRYPDHQVEVVAGGQPHYHYILSAE